MMSETLRALQIANDRVASSERFCGHTNQTFAGIVPVGGDARTEPIMRAPAQRLLAVTILASILAISLAGAALAQAPPTFDAAMAHYNLGDLKGARAEFETLAKAGDGRAQYNLGVMAQAGNGGPKDGVAALAWYRKSADQGNMLAMFNIALMYDDGDGVPVNKTEAVRWYRIAADGGDAASQYNLGQHYLDGDGVAKDAPTAIGWWRKAAEQGDAQAQFNMGAAYANGVGVAGDRIEAHKWFLLAAAAGYQDAAAAITQTKGKLTADEASQGEARAAQWKAKH